MASLCREFGISRKTGYKIFERYEQCGLEGLSDRTRRPFRYANQLPEQVEAAIVAAKREKPHWGARKIRERLLRRLPHAIKVPAASTVHAVLDRHGLVAPPGDHGCGPKAPPCRKACTPTICGRPMIRANSCWATSVTVIRLPSPTTLRAICCCVKHWIPIMLFTGEPHFEAIEFGSSGRTRTYNPSVNSRMLYH